MGAYFLRYWRYRAVCNGRKTDEHCCEAKMELNTFFQRNSSFSYRVTQKILCARKCVRSIFTIRLQDYREERGFSKVTITVQTAKSKGYKLAGNGCIQKWIVAGIGYNLISRFIFRKETQNTWKVSLRNININSDQRQISQTAELKRK